jgi:hypothetical protein
MIINCGLVRRWPRPCLRRARAGAALTPLDGKRWSAAQYVELIPMAKAPFTYGLRRDRMIFAVIVCNEAWISSGGTESPRPAQLGGAAYHFGDGEESGQGDR